MVETEFDIFLLTISFHYREIAPRQEKLKFWFIW